MWKSYLIPHWVTWFVSSGNIYGVWLCVRRYAGRGRGGMGSLGKSSETRYYMELKGSIGLHASKLNQTQTVICSQESKGLLLEEMAPSSESQVSYAQRPGSRMISRGWVMAKSWSWWLKGLGSWVLLTGQHPGRNHRKMLSRAGVLRPVSGRSSPRTGEIVCKASLESEKGAEKQWKPSWQEMVVPQVGKWPRC